jgi:NAD+-dependent secondary alcohol dehydrogenase Adh1
VDLAKVDGSHVDKVREFTDGMGAEAIIDFVGEKGAVEDGVAMLKDGGFYYVIGDGQNIDIPTIDARARSPSSGTSSGPRWTSRT